MFFALFLFGHTLIILFYWLYWIWTPWLSLILWDLGTLINSFYCRIWTVGCSLLVRYKDIDNFCHVLNIFLIPLYTTVVLQDLDTLITCSASNNNISGGVETSLPININCECGPQKTNKQTQNHKNKQHSSSSKADWQTDTHRGTDGRNEGRRKRLTLHTLSCIYIYDIHLKAQNRNKTSAPKSNKHKGWRHIRRTTDGNTYGLTNKHH